MLISRNERSQLMKIIKSAQNGERVAIATTDKIHYTILRQKIDFIIKNHTKLRDKIKWNNDLKEYLFESGGSIYGLILSKGG